MNPAENPNKKRLRRSMMFLNAQKPGLIKDPYVYGPDSIRIPKTETADDVRTVEYAIAEAEREFRRPVGSVLIMAALESAKGVLNALEICQSSPRMFGIALSGNPFASYATFELLTRPVLEAFSGRSSVAGRAVEGFLADAFPKPSYGRRFIRAHYEAGIFEIPAQHDSGSLFSAAGCNALIDIPAGTGPLMAGTRVKGVLL